MPNHACENVLRLMAARGLSLCRLAEQTGLHVRTIRALLRGGHRPHARTLGRLAEGLGVPVDELFVDPARLIYRRCDRRTNPVIAEVLKDRPELFDGWTESDFDELHGLIGDGRPHAIEEAIVSVQRMNRRRDLHQKLDLVLESSHAEVGGKILDALYESAIVPAESRIGVRLLRP